jgi:hypothetical protein
LLRHPGQISFINCTPESPVAPAGGGGAGRDRIPGLVAYGVVVGGSVATAGRPSLKIAGGLLDGGRSAEPVQCVLGLNWCFYRR